LFFIFCLAFLFFKISDFGLKIFYNQKFLFDFLNENKTNI